MKTIATILGILALVAIGGRAEAAHAFILTITNTTGTTYQVDVEQVAANHRFNLGARSSKTLDLKIATARLRIAGSNCDAAHLIEPQNTVTLDIGTRNGKCHLTFGGTVNGF